MADNEFTPDLFDLEKFKKVAEDTMQPLDPNAAQLSATPEMEGGKKLLSEIFPKLFGSVGGPGQDQKAAAAIALGEARGIPFSQAYAHFDELTSEMVNREPSGPAVIGGAGLAVGMMTAGAVPTLAAAVPFMVLPQLQDFLTYPEEGGKIRKFWETVDFIGKSALAHQFGKKAPDVVQHWTKEILGELHGPKTVFVSPDTAREIGAPAFQEMGVPASRYERALRFGMDVEVPAAALVTVVDRPWFAKLKQAVGLSPSRNVVGGSFVRQLGITGPDVPAIWKPPAPEPQDPFSAAVGFVFRHEGGLSNVPGDRGGLTNRGIASAYHPGVDVANLTQDGAREIYRNEYWTASGADKLPWPMSLVHFDTAVAMGPARAQALLNESGGDPAKYIQLREQAHAARVEEDPSQAKFLKSWLNRTADLKRVVGGDISAAPGEPTIRAMNIGGRSVTAHSELLGRLEQANRDMIAATGSGILVSSSFRTREQQQELYDRLAPQGARVATPGNSRHEKGLAIDVHNWKEAEPFLRKYGLVNPLKDDLGHFQLDDNISVAEAQKGFSGGGTVAERLARGSIVPGDTTTPEFREWSGGAPIAGDGFDFVTGKPVVVRGFHGTTKDFTSFSLEKLGESTNAASAELGFFFAKNPEVSGEFAKIANDFRKSVKGAMLDSRVISLKKEANSITSGLEKLEQQRHRVISEIDSKINQEGAKLSSTQRFERIKSHTAEIDSSRSSLLSRRREINSKLDQIEVEYRQSSERIYPTYIRFQNPKVVDVKGEKGVALSPFIENAKTAGHDGVIIKNTVDGGRLTDYYVALEPEQIKSVFNRGTWDPNDPNILMEPYREIVRESAKTRRQLEKSGQINAFRRQEPAVPAAPAGSSGGPAPVGTEPVAPEGKPPGSPPEPAGLTTIAKVFKDIVDTEVVDLRGLPVESPADLAVLAQQWRKPYEEFRWVFIKDGRIVDHEGLSCRLPGRTKAFLGKTYEAAVSYLQDRLARTGADTIFMVHNHPSGNPKPSIADIRLTQEVGRRVPEVRGHVVINSGKYALIDPDPYKSLPEPPIYDLPDLADDWVDPLRKGESAMEEVPGPLNEPSLVLSFAKRASQDKKSPLLIYLNSQLKLSGLQEVKDATLLQSMDWMPEQLRRFGTSFAFLYVPDKNGPVALLAPKLVKDGFVADVIFGNGEGVHDWGKGTPPAWDRMFGGVPYEVIEGDPVFLAKEEQAPFGGASSRDLQEYDRLMAEARKSADKIAREKIAKRAKKRENEYYRQAKALVDEDPVFQAMDFIVNNGGLKAKSLAVDYDLDTLKDLVRKRPRLIQNPGRIAPDEFAADNGFEDLDAMIVAFQDAPTKAEAIERQVEYLREENVEATEQDEAEYEAILADEEMKALSELTARSTEKMQNRPAKGLKQVIRRNTGQMDMSTLWSEAEALKGAMQKAARASREAYRAGRNEEALAQKERQRLIAWELKEKARERSTIKSMRLAMGEMAKDEKIPYEYREQIWAMLGPFRNQVKGRIPQPKETLDAFVQRMFDDGQPVLFDPELIRQLAQKPFGKLTIDEVGALHDAVANVYHLGKMERSFLDDKRKVSFDAAKARIIKSAMENARVITPPEHPLSNPTRAARFFRGYRGLQRELLKASTIFRYLDGWHEQGAWQTEINEIMVKATNDEMALLKAMRDKYREIFADVKGKMPKWMSKAEAIPGFPYPLTKWQQLSIYAHAQHPDNLAALKHGFAIDGVDLADRDIQTIIDNLKPEERNVIDRLINEFFPISREPLAAAYKQMTGVPLKMVEGKYVPMRFDKSRVPTNIRESEEAEAAKSYFNSVFPTSVKRAGSSHERKGGKYPLDLSPSVWLQWMTETAHYATHVVPVRDVLKLIKDTAVRDAVMSVTGGDDFTMRQIDTWLRESARPGAPPVNRWERKLGAARSRFNAFVLGYKVTTALVNYTAIFNAVPRIGGVSVMKGMVEYYKSPSQMTKWIHGKDPRMLMREENLDRDLRDLMTAKSGFTASLSAMDKAAFWAIGFVDGQAANAVWLGAYHKAINGEVEGIPAGDDDRATIFAGDVVEQTQGSGLPRTLAAIQRGGEAWKTLVSNLYGFMSTVYQLHWENWQKLRSGGSFADYLKAWFFLSVMASVTNELLRHPSHIVRPDLLAKAIVEYRLGAVPIIRDAIGGLLDGFDFRVGGIGTLIGETKRIGMAATAKKDSASKLMWELLRGVGMTTGMIPDQAFITIEGAHDLMTGKTDDPSRLLFRESKEDRKASGRR